MQINRTRTQYKEILKHITKNVGNKQHQNDREQGATKLLQQLMHID